MTLEGFRRGDYNGDVGSVSNAQQRVVAAATNNRMYGAVVNQCQAWAERVVEHALGIDIPNQCCARAAEILWKVSDDKTTIPVGAMVYGNATFGGACHTNYGHVGVYIGEGMVADNRNGRVPTIDTLDRWIVAFGWRGWGWAGGHDLRMWD